MDTAFDNHALLAIGVGILTAVALFVVIPNALPTALGKLNRQRRELRFARYERLLARRSLACARRRLDRLEARAARLKPAAMQAARDRAADLATLLKHAEERVTVAENHVRKVIVEEYPPVRQDRLLQKYVAGRFDQRLPFRF
jgi:hypothetical protein